MRGVPLTPEQVETLWRVFKETGNASEAARQAGCDERAGRRRIGSMREAERARLHAQARRRGVRKGAKALDRSVSLLDKVLQSEDAAGLSIEPRDLAALIRAQASAISELRALDAHVNQRLQWRLTRAKTKAEIAALTKDERDAQTPAVVALPSILATPCDDPPDDAT